MKPFWKSKTFWGIVFSIVQIILKKEWNIELPEIGLEGGLAASGGLTLYGLGNKLDKINGQV